MSAWVWILIVVLVIAAVVAYMASRRKRTTQLRDRFGDEYDRTVAERGGQRSAESELKAREERHDKLDIVALAPEARERYAASWRDAQTRFVDSPSDAVREADGLVQQVMSERGYPVQSFDQRESDISVEHPEVVQDYRAAHAISLANDHGEAGTEDLRQAMVHYRALFEGLLESGGDRTTDTV